MMAVNTHNEIQDLIKSAIADMDIDLSGQVVLTEAASGYFACTALTAALAKADHVFAVTKDSSYGDAKTIIEYNQNLSKSLAVDKKITYTSQPAINFAAESNIVTNLGFVRPIDQDLLNLLPEIAAISLMWEPWELRDSDLNIEVAKKLNIPVAGTREDHPRLKTMEYLGDLADKLIEETAPSNPDPSIAVIGSYPFGEAVFRGLKKKYSSISLNSKSYQEAEYIILAENRSDQECLNIDSLSSQTRIIHIAGVIDDKKRQLKNIDKHPDISVGAKHMTVTTAYANPKAVVDLHAAGLKVGGIMSSSMRDIRDPNIAIEKAVASGYGAAIGSRQAEDYIFS